MKTRNRVILLFLGLLLMLFTAACGSSPSDDDYDGKYKVAMITDAGDITDQSFNQLTYEACRDWCAEHGIAFSGHCLLEESLSMHIPLYGDLLRQLKTFDWPGVDMLTGSFRILPT